MVTLHCYGFISKEIIVAKFLFLRDHALGTKCSCKVPIIGLYFSSDLFDSRDIMMSSLDLLGFSCINL
jgi:hypothetical protein